MKTSDRGIALLTEWEGFETEVYHDAAGLPTIGVGHLLTQSERTSGKVTVGGIPIRYACGLSDEAVRALLRQDLARYEAAVNAGVQVPLLQNQFDALVSFTFNVGTGAFAGSTLLRLLNRRQYEDVPAQLRRWVYAAGKRIPGLVNRREKEIKLWQGT